jgi:hypothetical protein
MKQSRSWQRRGVGVDGDLGDGLINNEDKILERVKEMNELGLLDSDAQVSSDDVGFDTKVPYAPYTKLSTNYLPVAVVTDVESDHETEATLPSRPSRQNLRQTTSCSTIKSPKKATISSLGKPNTNDQKVSLNEPSQDTATISNRVPKSDSPRMVSDSANLANITDARVGSDYISKRDCQHSSISLSDMTGCEDIRLPEKHSSNKGRHRRSASLPLRE